MTALQDGDTAPDFALSDADGKTVNLSDFAPGKVIVYFYPAALTPGCTLEAVDFNSSVDAFAKAGYRIIGISPDSPDKIEKFREKEHLTITLLADPGKTVIELYGAWGKRMLYGKEIEGVIRSTFVIDLAADGVGTVLHAYHNVRASGHVDRLARDLKIDA
jgi:peroxiredoxin Q/BCP